jgi:hypothetical protein
MNDLNTSRKPVLDAIRELYNTSNDNKKTEYSNTSNGTRKYQNISLLETQKKQQR